MGQTPTSNSVPVNNAAKDDAVGLNGDYTFTIADLLANDPGGAAKISTTTQFFFGDTAADRADQAGYLAAHGITDNHDGTYTITADGIDFSYFVQIGNKGTWSQGDVDVTAPEVVIEPHEGGPLFVENFDGYGAATQTTYYDPPGTAVFASVNLNAASGWNSTYNELGADGYGGIETTSGTPPEAFWLDTQNSTGQINISHTFTDDTDPVLGKTSILQFDVAKQSLDYLGQHYETAATASLDVLIDGAVVKTITMADLATFNDMYHFVVGIDQYADLGDDTHVITIQDTSPDAAYTGFGVDRIKINDWVI
jgi:hypothetical protein